MKKKIKELKFELVVTDVKGETKQLPIYNSKNWVRLVKDMHNMDIDVEHEFLKSLAYDLKKTLNKLSFNYLTGELHE